MSAAHGFRGVFGSPSFGRSAFNGPAAPLATFGRLHPGFGPSVGAFPPPAQARAFGRGLEWHVPRSPSPWASVAFGSGEISGGECTAYREARSRWEKTALLPAKVRPLVGDHSAGFLPAPEGGAYEGRWTYVEPAANWTGEVVLYDRDKDWLVGALVRGDGTSAGTLILKKMGSGKAAGIYRSNYNSWHHGVSLRVDPAVAGRPTTAVLKGSRGEGTCPPYGTQWLGNMTYLGRDGAEGVPPPQVYQPDAGPSTPSSQRRNLEPRPDESAPLPDQNAPPPEVPGEGLGWGTWALVGAGVLVLGGGAWWLLSRRKKSGGQ